jgi:hypothetical protein
MVHCGSTSIAIAATGSAIGPAVEDMCVGSGIFQLHGKLSVSQTTITASSALDTQYLLHLVCFYLAADQQLGFRAPAKPHPRERDHRTDLSQLPRLHLPLLQERAHN